MDSVDTKIDLQKYIIDGDKQIFAYSQVYSDARFSKNADTSSQNKQIKEKLNQFLLEKQLTDDQFNHETYQMKGRAALLIVMKRTGEEGGDNNKQLLDIILNAQITKQKEIQQLKSTIFSDIEKRFDELKI